MLYLPNVQQILFSWTIVTSENVPKQESHFQLWVLSCLIKEVRTPELLKPKNTMFSKMDTTIIQGRATEGNSYHPEAQL